MVAVAAAGIAAAASVAAAGVQAGTAGGKGGGGAPTMKGMAPWEKIFNRGTADMLDEERRVMEDSVAQANWMQPEMYAALGYEPIYDDNASPEALKQMGDAADALRRRAQEGKISIEESRVDIKEARRELKTLKGKKNKARRQELKETIREAHATIKTAKQDDGPLQRESAAAEKQLGDMQTLPRRVIGLKKIEPSDPTGSADGAYRKTLDVENAKLMAALRGDEPVNSTLAREFKEREDNLRERLRRQMGPDYETSTAGSEALANFDRERNEAFQQFNTQQIKDYSALTESRATSLSNLTGARLQQLAYPANNQAARALSLGQAANDRNGIAQIFQHERLAQYEGKKDAYGADSANAAARGAAIASLLDKTGQGVSAGLGTYLGSGSSTSATPDTVSIPSY